MITLKPIGFLNLTLGDRFYHSENESPLIVLFITVRSSKTHKYFLMIKMTKNFNSRIKTHKKLNEL